VIVLAVRCTDDDHDEIGTYHDCFS